MTVPGTVREQNQVPSGCVVKGQDWVYDQDQGSVCVEKVAEKASCFCFSMGPCMCVLGQGVLIISQPEAPSPVPHQQVGITAVSSSVPFTVRAGLPKVHLKKQTSVAAFSLQHWKAE